MAIHGVGTPLRWSEIQAEFGGTNPISISEYYSGGAFVIAGVNANIPTSGVISANGFFGAVRGFVFNPVFATGTTTYNYNLHAAAIAAGWDGIVPLISTLTNNGIIGSTANNTYALTIGTFPAGSIINIINNYYISGKGGNGGNGAPLYPPTAGGPALFIGGPCTITNNGVIQGGGGGGGVTLNGFIYQNGGGGGAGSTPGAAGYGNVTPGGPGTLTTGGGGAVPGGGPGAPGAGGNWYGGAAGGAATTGAALATWAVVGTRYGTVA